MLWFVSKLGAGEKFQLQAQFKMISQEEEGTVGEKRDVPIFPVLVRCHGSTDILSDINVSVAANEDTSTPVIMRAAHRFRIAHKEQLA